MRMEDILMLLGGLALFLYGMQMMSNGLETAAGNKMKSILEKLTSNRIKRCRSWGCDHSRDSVFICYNCCGGRICQFGSDDTESGSLGDHGSQYRYNDHRTADRT